MTYSLVRGIRAITFRWSVGHSFNSCDSCSKLISVANLCVCSFFEHKFHELNECLLMVNAIGVAVSHEWLTASFGVFVRLLSVGQWVIRLIRAIRVQNKLRMCYVATGFQRTRDLSKTHWPKGSNGTNLTNDHWKITPMALPYYSNESQRPQSATWGKERNAEGA